MRRFFRHVAPRSIGEHSDRNAGDGGVKGGPAALSVTELCNLDRTKRSVRNYGRVDEFEEWWEKDVLVDDGEEYIIGASGKIALQRK